MDYQDFQNKWLHKRVDTDGFPKGAIYQCADLVKQYMRDCYGVVYGAYGNAIDYWTRPAAAVMAKFDKIQTRDVRTGDLVPLSGLGDNPFGHIGIATGAQTSTTIEVLEQNGSTGKGQGTRGDAVRKRFVPKSRVPGVLRPKAVHVPSPANHPYAWAVGKTVHLIGTSWRVYKVGSTAPREAVATLAPNKYGGLDYKILATDTAKNSVVIETSMFGRVSLPLGYGERIT